MLCDIACKKFDFEVSEVFFKENVDRIEFVIKTTPKMETRQNNLKS